MVSPSLGLKYNMIDMARNQYLSSTLNIFTENHELKILHLYQVSWFCMKKIIVNLSCCEGEYSLVICHPCILVSSPCIDTIYVDYRGKLGLRHEIITFERTSHSSRLPYMFVANSSQITWTRLIWVFKAYSDVQSTSNWKHPGCILLQGFYVGCMGGMLVCDNTLPVCHMISTTGCGNGHFL